MVWQLGRGLAWTMWRVRVDLGLVIFGVDSVRSIASKILVLELMVGGTVLGRDDKEDIFDENLDHVYDNYPEDD